jgi:hypothetical protein
MEYEGRTVGTITHNMCILKPMATSIDPTGDIGYHDCHETPKDEV